MKLYTLSAISQALGVTKPSVSRQAHKYNLGTRVVGADGEDEKRWAIVFVERELEIFEELTGKSLAKLKKRG